MAFALAVGQNCYAPFIVAHTSPSLETHDTRIRGEWEGQQDTPTPEPVPTPEPASEPPAQPTGLEVFTEPGSLDVSVDWDDVDGTVHYRVRWRSVDNGGELNDGVEVQPSEADTTVEDYGEWVVRVQACNDAG